MIRFFTRATRAAGARLTAVAALATLAPLVPLAVGCAPRPDEAACRAMLDRYVEMSARGEPSLAGLGESAAADRVRELVVNKRAQPVYARAVERCRSETSGGALACAMKAPTPNEWEACVQ